MPIVVLVKYQAQPGKHDLAAREIASLVKTVIAAEQGCLGISVLRSDSSEHQFLLHARWSAQGHVFWSPHADAAPSSVHSKCRRVSCGPAGHLSVARGACGRRLTRRCTGLEPRRLFPRAILPLRAVRAGERGAVRPRNTTPRMSAITPNSTDAAVRSKIPSLMGVLALVVGLPFLGYFVLRHIASVQRVESLSALSGNVWSWREHGVAFLISPVIVPALWCAVAAYFAARRAPRPVRAISAGLLAIVVVWVVVLAARIATL